MSVRPAKTQISLGIHQVGSESALCTQWVAKDPSFLHMDSEDPPDWADADWSKSLLGAQAILLVLSCRGSCLFNCNIWWIIALTIARFFNTDLQLKECVKKPVIPVIMTIIIIIKFQLIPVKRICVFEHSVITNFNCACPAIQMGKGSGFLSEGSSWLTACMSEQRRFWGDCADAQARLNLRCSHRQ